MDITIKRDKNRILPIGSLILRRLKRHGIKRVYGFLSDADDRVKAMNFWLKLGFALDGDELTKKL
jgi:hypothetical protein